MNRQRKAAVSSTVGRLVLHCLAPGCAVTYWGPGQCPSCGGPGEKRESKVREIEHGRGAMCDECGNQAVCVGGAEVGADLREWSDQSETCFAFDPLQNAGEHRT